MITGGRILVAGADVTKMSERDLRRFRAREASMVYQDPGTALNPTLKIGRQVAEAFTVLGDDKQGSARSRRATRCAVCASPTRTGSWSATRTSSRAACSSAS